MIPAFRRFESSRPSQFHHQTRAVRQSYSGCNRPPMALNFVCGVFSCRASFGSSSFWNSRTESNNILNRRTAATVPGGEMLFGSIHDWILADRRELIRRIGLTPNKYCPAELAERFRRNRTRGQWKQVFDRENDSWRVAIMRNRHPSAPFPPFPGAPNDRACWLK